jgi:hypothetical protein
MAMSNTVTIEGSMAASFKQASGPSRPGIDWAIQIGGARSGMVVVRTYCSSNPPHEAEKKALGEKAVRFVQTKLEQGWLPWPGVLEAE